jgi:hypothetical protein
VDQSGSWRLDGRRRNDPERSATFVFTTARAAYRRAYVSVATRRRSALARPAADVGRRGLRGSGSGLRACSHEAQYRLRPVLRSLVLTHRHETQFRWRRGRRRRSFARHVTVNAQVRLWLSVARRSFDRGVAGSLRAAQCRPRHEGGRRPTKCSLQINTSRLYDVHCALR